jgi:hypothetical protein
MLRAASGRSQTMTSTKPSTPRPRFEAAAAAIRVATRWGRLACPVPFPARCGSS